MSIRSEKWGPDLLLFILLELGIPNDARWRSRVRSAYNSSQLPHRLRKPIIRPRCCSMIHDGPTDHELSKRTGLQTFELPDITVPGRRDIGARHPGMTPALVEPNPMHATHFHNSSRESTIHPNCCQTIGSDTIDHKPNERTKSSASLR